MYCFLSCETLHGETTSEQEIKYSKTNTDFNTDHMVS